MADFFPHDSSPLYTVGVFLHFQVNEFFWNTQMDLLNNYQSKNLTVAGNMSGFPSTFDKNFWVSSRDHEVLLILVSTYDMCNKAPLINIYELCHMA